MKFLGKNLAHDIAGELQRVYGFFFKLKRVIEKNEEKSKVIDALNALQNSIENFNKDVMDVFQDKTSIMLKEFISDFITKDQGFSELKLEVTGKSEILVYVKKGDLKRFLKNILRNAQEAQATKVTFKFIGTKLVISDNGIGFTTEQLNKLKVGERFTSKHTGNGIGVESMREFCAEMETTLEFFNNINNKGAMLVLAKNL